jgi:hypothetical protein
LELELAIPIDEFPKQEALGSKDKYFGSYTPTSYPIQATRWQRTTPFIKGMLGALLGTALIYGALHIYYDHQFIHALIENIQQQQAKAQQSQLPTPSNAKP